MPKYTIEDIKKIPPKTLLKLIQRAKNFLKKNDVFCDMCKEYDVSPEIIDVVPIKFGDLDVSARTDHGVITLSYKLLLDGDFLKDYQYIVHETKHLLDQCYGERPTKGADEGDYLKNKDEQAAFKVQIKYIDDQFGEDQANSYVDQLLDHHDKDGKDRNELKEVLMEEVDE